jgi:hypothetical protein
MTNGQKLAVLSVHGIGFQQPPTASTDGYADELHRNLSQALQEIGSSLGRDPQRTPHPFGPVYVRSVRPGSTDTEWGLSRLGTWRDDGSIDTAGMPLTDGDEPIVQVALVYTPLEGMGPGMGTGAGTLGEAGLMLGHYATVAGTLRLAVGDAWAALHEHAARTGAAAATSPSLRPRTDVLSPAAQHRSRLLHREPGSGGTPDIIRTLEDDVVSYVCRNSLRESIREFVAEALRRLLARPDVAGVVVNAHSQGTVGTFDVLRLYLSDAEAGVRAFVTAGSPLRKYADLFSWGYDAGGLRPARWLNFWDEKDPVADPLSPPQEWQFGDAPAGPAAGGLGLFWGVNDAGEQVPVTITDVTVDNLKHSAGGGLQAHNYWDNKEEFIPRLAALLKAEAG